MAMDPEDPFNLMPLIENQENIPFNLKTKNQENEESWKAWADRSPPGYKFHPSDETLFSEYLIKKQLREALPPNNILEFTTYYSTHPEVIVVEHPLHVTQDSLFFFSLRDEKYPQHTKAIRDAANGYWRTTTNVPVHTNNVIGQKRTLVFLEGKMKDAVKTNWHMHEYSIKIKPTPNAVDWVIVRLSPPQLKMKSLQPGLNTQNQQTYQPQNDQLQHRQLLGDFGADRSWENSAPQGPQPLQPQMVQNVNLLQPYLINQNHQMYKPQNDPLQHRQLLSDFGADWSWENPTLQGPQPMQPQMLQNVNLLQPYLINQNHQMYKPQNDPLQHRQLLSDFGADWSWENPTLQGLQPMQPQMEKNVNLLQPYLITQNQQMYQPQNGPLQHRQLLGDFGVDQSWENPAPQGPQPMQPQMLQNVNLLISHDQQMYQPQHGLPQFMQQLGDFGADWSSAPQGPPPMQLPCDFGADWSGEQPAVYEGSPFGANRSNLRGDWSWEQLSTAADSLLGSNILPNANVDIAQQNLDTNLNPTAQLGANPGGGEQMTDEEN